jgi:hypothetical protein
MSKPQTLVRIWPLRGGSIGRNSILPGIGILALALLSGCGTVKLVATPNIPTPLIAKIPVAVALYVPKEFSEYVHKEKRISTDWNVDIGKGQTAGITRLMTAMFDRVVLVDSVNAGSQAGSDIKAILQPSVEEFAFVTPQDAGSPFFAVSIKYRVDVYAPDGRLADSWGFTGYGTAPSQGLSGTSPLEQAASLAMRDAGAKLAVEFRDQAVMRTLLPESAQTPPSEAAPPAAAPTPAPAAATKVPEPPAAPAPTKQSSKLPKG